MYYLIKISIDNITRFVKNNGAKYKSIKRKSLLNGEVS